jgi:hypothetical protein
MPKATGYTTSWKQNASCGRADYSDSRFPNILRDDHFAAFLHFTQPWFVDHPFPMYFYTPSELTSLLVRAGFWLEHLDDEIIARARKTGVGGIDPALNEQIAKLDPWLR